MELLNGMQDLNAREDRHIVKSALKNRITTSQTISPSIDNAAQRETAEPQSSIQELHNVDFSDASRVCVQYSDAVNISGDFEATHFACLQSISAQGPCT